MSDTLKLSALTRNEAGEESIRTLTARERDSEIISDDDCMLMFDMACTKCGLTRISNITQEYV